MTGESLQFKRCCFCLPLRRGLIGWGYFKVTVDLLALIHLVACLFPYQCPAIYHGDVTLCLIFITFFVTDAVFAVMFTVGGHKKNHKLLRISKIFSIVWLVPVLVFGGLFAYSDITTMQRMGITSIYEMPDLAMDISVSSAIIFLQIYVILLTRSEEMKLRKEHQGMQFVNNAADGESVCVCTDNGHDAEIVL